MATFRDRALELAEAAVSRAGISVVERDRLALLESRDREAGALRRELDSLAWTALNYSGGNPQELKVEERLKLVQKARVVWMKDPMAGASVDLMNEFTFGRGIPKPTANDAVVQEVIDEAWEDPDNEDTLTSMNAQFELGTDLSLQSNLFVLVFDDGEDGKVKLAILDHDSVERVVRDSKQYRKRILYYVTREFTDEVLEEDFRTGQPKINRRTTIARSETVYYEHWRNVEAVKDDIDKGLREAPPNLIDAQPGTQLGPESRLGEGKVFHIYVNKTGEMAFGHPTFDRLIGWYNAYNRFIDARVDIMEASAAFVMKKKVKGSPSQLRKQATQALSRRSALGMSRIDPATGEEVQPGPRPASIIAENEEVTYEDFNISTNATQAAEDARMIRAQISAATRWPQTFYGDGSNTNLATATSLELPVLKAVEARQELFERLVRFFIDRVIQRAVETGRIKTELSEEERAKLEAKKEPQAPPTMGLPPQGVEMSGGPPPLRLAEFEGQAQDEADTERDLNYKFSMPNPLRRMLTDLVTAIMNVARTFDPNNTNMELSKTLLTIALGEGLELEDPAAEVDRIFPEGYVDPAVAAAQAQMAQMPSDPQFGEFAPGGAEGADGQRHTEANPYGAPQRAQPAEKAMQQAAWPVGRDGTPVLPAILQEARFADLDPRIKDRAAGQVRERDKDFQDSIGGLVAALTTGQTEGRTE